MKTAISIPDPIFKEAEKLANRLGMTRSALFTKAIKKYLEDHPSEGVTKKLNGVYEKEISSVDTILQTLQMSSIKKDDW